MAAKKREQVTIYGVNVSVFREQVTATVESAQAVPYGTSWRTLGEHLAAFGYSTQPTASVASKARKALASAAPRAGVIWGVKDLRDSVSAAATRVLGEERGSRFAQHYFRHNRITHWAEGSKNLAGVMYLAGHRRPDTTARYIKPSFRAAQEVLGTRGRRP